MEAGYSITPLTPIEDVYYALQTITDYKTGVQDKSKIMLQISFDWIVWKKKDGKILEAVPGKYNLENFMKLLKSDQEIEYYYDEKNANPYIKYIDTSTGVENIVWYENSQSVMEKVKLAKLFGIEGISLWRLGQIPNEPDIAGKPFNMDIWQRLLNEME
jgi:spore germination protein YaaH